MLVQLDVDKPMAVANKYRFTSSISTSGMSRTLRDLDLFDQFNTPSCCTSDSAQFKVLKFLEALENIPIHCKLYR